LPSAGARLARIRDSSLRRRSCARSDQVLAVAGERERHHAAVARISAAREVPGGDEPVGKPGHGRRLQGQRAGDLAGPGRMAVVVDAVRRPGRAGPYRSLYGLFGPMKGWLGHRVGY